MQSSLLAVWRKQERRCRKERGERTLAGGPWGGVTWCWIKNQRCVHTTDGAGTRRRPVSQAQINGKNWKLAQPHTSVFPWDMVPLTGQRRDGLCVFVGVLRGFGILMKTLSHYSVFIQKSV